MKYILLVLLCWANCSFGSSIPKALIANTQEELSDFNLKYGNLLSQNKFHNNKKNYDTDTNLANTLLFQIQIPREPKQLWIFRENACHLLNNNFLFITELPNHLEQDLRKHFPSCWSDFKNNYL